MKYWPLNELQTIRNSELGSVEEVLNQKFIDDNDFKPKYCNLIVKFE